MDNHPKKTRAYLAFDLGAESGRQSLAVFAPASWKFGKFIAFPTAP
jgi:hypothetical protein